MTFTTKKHYNKNYSSQKREAEKIDKISKLSTARVSLASREISALESLDPLVADAFIKLSLERWLNFDDFFLRQIDDNYRKADDLDKKLFLWRLYSIADTRDKVALLASELKKS